MIADYDKVGPFTNDAPPAVDADAFDQFEDGIDTVTTEAQRLAGDPALPNVPIDHEASLRSGSWTIMGSDGAFDSTHEYMIAYFGGGIYWDGALWQCPGGSQGNGWSILGVHASGVIYVYGDTSSGTGSRTYSAAAFMAKREGAIPATPATFFEDGTIDGQTIVWNQSGGVWEVGTIDIPSRYTDSKTTVTTLGPSATGTIDLLNGEFTLPADTIAIGQMMKLTAWGRIKNNTGGVRTLTFTPKFGGVDLGVAVAPGVGAGTALNKYWRAAVELLRTGTTTAEASFWLTVYHHVNSTDSANVHGKNAAVTGLTFTSSAAVLLNGNQTLSDADLQHSLTGAFVEVV